MPVPEKQTEIDRLLAVVAHLRGAQHGYDWAVAQTFASLAPYAIEEGYEVADALLRGDPAGIKDELGDLLLQVVLNAQLAADLGLFVFDDVAAATAEKMIRRHPHVFAGAAARPDWEATKATERGASDSVLDGVALALPALMRAQKIQARAARVGFDWPDATGPREKIVEELGEVDAASSPDAVTDEIGDLLFSVVNYGRHRGIDAEAALRGATAKFERRFRTIERQSGFAGATLEELETMWRTAKRDVRS